MAFEYEVVSKVYRLSGGYPFFVQLWGRILVDRRVEAGWVAVPEVDAIVDQVVALGGGQLLDFECIIKIRCFGKVCPGVVLQQLNAFVRVGHRLDPVSDALDVDPFAFHVLDHELWGVMLFKKTFINPGSAIYCPAKPWSDGQETTDKG